MRISDWSSDVCSSDLLRIEDSLRVALGAAGQHLPRYQRLAGYAVVREPLPRTRLGKYRRFLLPQLYRQARDGKAAGEARALPAEDRAFLRAPVAAQVWQMLRPRYPSRPFDRESSLQLDPDSRRATGRERVCQSV